MADVVHSVPRSNAGNMAKPNPLLVVLKIVGKTLLPVFVTLFGLAALTFFIGRMLPIDPVVAILGDNATQEAYDNMARALGLDKPLWYQFGIYVRGILSLDFGQALTTGKPVIEDIARVFPATIELATLAIIIGIVNLVVLVGVWRAFRQVRRTGRYVEADLEMLLANQGVLARILRPLFRLVTRSWHMYPLGLLFALGFDTATEVSLFGLSAAQASQGTDIWTILVFPALFTAGMTLVDATDGVLMLGAYSWAYVQPMRKLFYNLTITLVSVAVALVIGTLEALNLLADKLNLQGWLWQRIAAINDHFGVLGFGIVGLFAAAWLLSFLIYRLGRFDRIAVEPADMP